MDGLVLDLSGGADAPLAFDAEGDAAMGQRGLGAGGQVDDPAGADLAPSMPPVRGAMLAGAHFGAFPIESLQENSVKSRIWIAITVYLLAAIIKKRLNIEDNLHTIFQIPSLPPFEKVPRQLLVRVPKGRNQVTPLPHDTSLLEVRAALPPGGEDVMTLDGMCAFSLPAALIACPARFFRLNPVDARTALALAPDASALLRRLLDGGHDGTVAGRLAAAFRSIGREQVADDIAEAMRAADFSVRERDPFRTPALALARAMRSPRRLGQQAAFCFREAGVGETCGKTGNALLYRGRRGVGRYPGAFEPRSGDAASAGSGHEREMTATGRLPTASSHRTGPCTIPESDAGLRTVGKLNR